MRISLEQIKAPVKKEVDSYELYLREALGSENTMTSAMLEYIIDGRGKGVRPLMTLLTASMLGGGGKLPDRSRLAAMLVEMMHTASLVHDDVIDEAYLRRGKPSVKALWRSHRAVLIGDYILAKTYSVAMASGDYDIVKEVVAAMGDLVQGELEQSEQSDLLQMTRPVYDSIIYKKTASLIGVSCAAGAMSVDADKDAVEAMRRFGDNLGMAFQIRDDLLDYTSSEKTGKPVCGDIRERKINLPLLMVLEDAGEVGRDAIISLLRDVRERPENAQSIAEMVTEGGGIIKAGAEMEKYIGEALSELASFPDNIYRRSLEQLCRYVAERDI